MRLLRTILRLPFPKTSENFRKLPVFGDLSFQPGDGSGRGMCVGDVPECNQISHGRAEILGSGFMCEVACQDARLSPVSNLARGWKKCVSSI